MPFELITCFGTWHGHSIFQYRLSKESDNTVHAYHLCTLPQRSKVTSPFILKCWSSLAYTNSHVLSPCTLFPFTHTVCTCFWLISSRKTRQCSVQSFSELSVLPTWTATVNPFVQEKSSFQNIKITSGRYIALSEEACYTSSEWRLGRMLETKLPGFSPEVALKSLLGGMLSIIFERLVLMQMSDNNEIILWLLRFSKWTVIMRADLQR